MIAHGSAFPVAKLALNNSVPPILMAIKIGGTELFSASFATGKALPCAIIIKNKINKCFNGNLLTHCKRIGHGFVG